MVAWQSMNGWTQKKLRPFLPQRGHSEKTQRIQGVRRSGPQADAFILPKPTKKEKA